MARTSPNIVITGTPGVGKTTHCEVLAQRTGLRHLSVNNLVKDRECHEGWDDEFQSWIVDEDKVNPTPFWCTSVLDPVVRPYISFVALTR